MEARSCKVSHRQVWAGIFVGLLAPAAVLPSLAARYGPWGWLGVGVTAALAPLYLRLVKGLGTEGLASALRRWGWFGRCVLAVYYIWVMALAALTAGGCVDRLSRTDYGAAPGWVAAVLLAVAAAYLIYRGSGAFLRATQIFFLALAVLLAAFLLLGAANLDRESLRPENGREVLRGLGGAWPALATAGVGMLGAFIPHEARGEGESRGWRWLAGWSLTAAGLCALVIGALGAEVTVKAPLPFFLALQGIGFPGGFQRLEAVGTAAWVLSDLVLIGLAALAAVQITEKRGGRWPVLLAAAAGGVWLPNAVVAAAQEWLFIGNVALGVVLPVLAAAGRRKQARGGGP